MAYEIAPFSARQLTLWEPKQLESAEKYTKQLLLTAYNTLPPTEPSNSNALQTLADAYEVGRKIYEHPLPFTYNLINLVTEDIQKEINQTIHTVAQDIFTSPNISFSTTSEQCFEKAKQAFSLFSSLLQQTKEDLKRMFVDLFTAFVIPLSLEASNIPLSLNLLNACSMTGAALFIHKLAIEHLKEDSDQAKSLTCGAIMGIWISFVMDQSLYIGMLSGATVALVTDTALVALSRNSVTRFFKKQYREWQVEKRVATICKLGKTIFPYIFSTLGTAFVYAKLRPITDLLLKDNPPSSEKIYTIQLVAISAMLFGMGTFYLSALAKSLIKPITAGLSSAEQTRRILFWAPRVLSILCITSISSAYFKKH